MNQLLREYQSVPDNLPSEVEKLKGYIDMLYQDAEWKESEKYKGYITKEFLIPNFKIFGSRCNVDVCIFKSSNRALPEGLIEGGGYKPYEHRLNIELSESNYDDLGVVLYHELTHKIQFDSPSIKSTKATLYNLALEHMNDEDDYMRSMASLIYLFHKLEMSAYLSEMYYEIMHNAKKDAEAVEMLKNDNLSDKMLMKVMCRLSPRLEDYYSNCAKFESGCKSKKYIEALQKIGVNKPNMIAKDLLERIHQYKRKIQKLAYRCRMELIGTNENIVRLTHDNFIEMLTESVKRMFLR